MSHSNARNSGIWRQTRRPSRPTILTPADAQQGLFAIIRFQNVGQDSMLWTQPHINREMSDHPVVVIGSKNNGAISCCLQTTSFGDRAIRMKYPDPTNIMRQHYLAVRHNATVPHNGLPVLNLAAGAQMQKQSYVHLDFFFEIETKYLETWYGSTKCLDGPSTLALQAQFRDLLSGKKRRMSPSRNRPLSPLEVRAYSPRSLGIPEAPVIWKPCAADFKPTFQRTRVGNAAIAIVAPSSPSKAVAMERSWRQVVAAA